MTRSVIPTAGSMALALFLASPAAISQNRIEILEALGYSGGSVVISGGAPAMAPGKDGEKEEKKEKTERQKKLEKLTFDRRPSVMLTTWSTPPKSEEDEEGEDTVEEVVPEGPTSQPVTSEAEVATELVVPEVVEVEVEPTPEELEAAKKAEEKAAEEKEKAEEAAAKEAEAKALEEELKLFQRNVTLGEWADVKTYLASLEEDEAKAAYKQLLVSLVKGPVKVNGPLALYAEKNFFAPEDIASLAGLAPHEPERKDLDQLARLVKSCVDQGNLSTQVILELSNALEAEALSFDSSELAYLLIVTGYPVEAGDFLPEPEAAIEENDRSTLNLLSRHYLALHAKEKTKEPLEKAWQVLQAVLADGEVSDEDKKEALSRAVDIAPKVSEELGDSWLDESFTARPERGMEILTVIGTEVSNGMFTKAQLMDQRLKSLELQTTAAKALLAAAPERAEEWASSLTLLASNWLREAQHTYQHDTSTQRGPAMNRDIYGNFYYYNYSYNRTNPNLPKPLPTDKVLDVKPTDEWLRHIPVGLKPKLDMVTAQLLLKVNEEDEAFPYIESLALVHPDQAKDLVEEFLRVWTKNHNPNDANSRRNRYVYFYGYEQRKDAIPLTRSKQERNLKDLAVWIARIKALPLEDIDEELIASAFTSAHSQAEVYRIETIERVFGEMSELDPKTLAELIQKMRSNLVTVWKEPSVQKDKKTKRRQKDIQAEVLRGYEVARQVAEKGLVDHPGNWSLLLAKASVLHDENNYRQELKKDSEFASRRQAAFDEFQLAADAYAEAAMDLPEEKESVKVFSTWFYAALGACDLDAVDEDKIAVQAQFPKIRAAIDGLSGERAERHLASFASTLFSRMGSASPAVKYRYARAGLEVVGDHERARDVKDVYEYYADLITEIKLETRVDGADRVGNGEPFGVYVDLVHTREIEREAGGFSKYLTNQNNQGFSWNYGRPTENYRDKFEEAARDALEEQYEVLSITFNHPDTNSRALEEYGWRVTPYAYLLLEARGEEVDRLPSMRLDLDFLDTTGYAVLPIESPPLPLDASEREPRPFQGLEVTQTLDERQAKEGKLVLEVKAKALGLVPELDEFLDLDPGAFEVVENADQGVAVAKFDEEAEDATVVSERIWNITLRGREDLEALPDAFAFADAKVEDAEMIYQRFVDADLASVERVVKLEYDYGETAGMSPWRILFGILVLGGLGLWTWIAYRRSLLDEGPRARFAIPDNVSPFTVIGLLRDIQSRNGISTTEERDLLAQIERVERYYFQNEGEDAPDLPGIAREWVARAR